MSVELRREYHLLVGDALVELYGDGDEAVKGKFEVDKPPENEGTGDEE
jgi:hypothetical protein